MIEIKHSNGQSDIKIDGDMSTIIAESLTIVRALYAIISEAGESYGDMFRTVLTKDAVSGRFFNIDNVSSEDLDE